MYKLGIDAKLYINTGSYATPTWTLIDDARDVSIPMTGSEADASRRGGGGFREVLAGLLEVGIDFEVLYDSADTAFIALRQAFLARTTVDMAAVDGPIATNGTQGLRIIGVVTDFTKNEAMESPQAVAVKVRPTPNSDTSPTWMTISS